MNTMHIDLKDLRSVILEAMLNAYQVLGVQPNATDEEIKAAWKKLALQNHPDRGGSHGKMVDINNAKTRLLDKAAKFRFGANIKGYEDASTPPPAQQSSTPAMKDCPKCGRNVAVKDGKYINHYNKPGGPEKCSHSGQASVAARSNAGGQRGDDFWSNYWQQAGRSQRTPPNSNPNSGRPPNNTGTSSQNWTRYFTYTEGSSNKFWEIHVEDRKVTTRWGRIGHMGSVNATTYNNPREALFMARKLIASKVKKGYTAAANQNPNNQERTNANPPPPPPRPEQGSASGEKSGQPMKGTYKVYPYRGSRRVVRVGGKVFGTGQGGRLPNGAQTQFQGNERAEVSRDGDKMKVKKPNSDHTQTWDPIDEIRQIVDNMIIEMLVEIAHK